MLRLVKEIYLTAGTSFFGHVPKWVIGIIFLALCGANHYLLVVCRHGILFEHDFHDLKKSRKVVLVASCVAMILAVIAFFIYSAVVHRRFVFELNSTR